MRLFYELVLRSFRRQMAYRTATMAGLITNFFFGILRVSILLALYDGRPQVNGLTMTGAITYASMTQALIGFLSLFGWYELMESVHTGAVGSDLLKPMGYYRFWLAQDLGRALAQLILRGLPMMAAFALLFGIAPPATPLAAIGFVASLFLAWMVSFSWRFLVNLSSFWVPNALGIGRFFFTLAYFLSGFLMPLALFPEWFNTLCRLTPFPYSVYSVIEIYLGLVSGRQMLAALLAQAAWAIGLVVLGQVVLWRGMRRLTIAGG